MFSNKNFITDGNGILCCYDMFPRQFVKNDKGLKPIEAMADYIPKISQMGFNAVWINPIQEPGNGEVLTKRDKNIGVRINNLVSYSLYAMKYPYLINREFSVVPRDDNGNLLVTEDKAFELDKIALRNFTDTARKNNIVPMFDLVMNHVASDAPLCNEKPHWFKGIDPDFKDARKFNYDDAKIRGEIIKEFWEPYIRCYMLDYGFDGVRVDAVGYLHPELRKEIYELINKIARENNKPKPVILDEALFSDKPVHLVAETLRLDHIGPTHITSGVYYVHQNEKSLSGGLPQWTKEESGVKASIVFQNKTGELKKNVNSGGSINFCGNHDHNSLSMMILYEMAHERLNADSKMENLCHRVMKTVDNKGNYGKEEAVESIFLHSYINDIQQEALKNDSIKEDIERRMREKIATCALIGGGGWFILSGDETGDTTAKPVFLRMNHEEIYSHREHSIFELNPTIAYKVLNDMAIEAIQKDSISPEKQATLGHNGLAGAYSDLTNFPELQKRLLSAYIENFKNQINSKLPVTCNEFLHRMLKHGINVSFEAADYKSNERKPENGWQGRYDVREYVTDINKLLKEMPSSQLGFWSEMFKLQSHPDLAIVVRKNGFGFDSPTDIVIVNLNRNQKISFTQDDLHRLAVAFQERTISVNDRYPGNQYFDQAYNAIMNADIHCDSKIELSINKKQENKLTTDVHEIKRE